MLCRPTRLRGYARHLKPQGQKETPVTSPPDEGQAAFCTSPAKSAFAATVDDAGFSPAITSSSFFSFVAPYARSNWISGAESSHYKHVTGTIGRWYRSILSY
jgi:hypothetical protein